MGDLSAADIANALEDQAVVKAMGLGPQNPFDALKSNEIVSDSQLNQALMTPTWDSSKLTLMLPKTRVESGYVLKRGSDGKPIYFKGKPLVEPKEVRIFDGFEIKTVDLPCENVFKPDMRNSFLRPDDRNMMQILLDLYFFIIQESIATEEDFSYDLYNINQKMGSILNICPSVGGKQAELTKSTFTKSEQSNTIRQLLLNEQRGKGIFGIFKKKQQF